jgi:hypothetical protein
MLIGSRYKDYYDNAYPINRFLVYHGNVCWLSTAVADRIWLEFREAMNYGAAGASNI